MPEDPSETFTVPEAEWARAKAYFRENPSEVKLRKHDAKTSCSFIQVNGEIYALANHDYLGQGTYGKVKVAQNQDGQRFAVKIEGRALRAEDEPELIILKLVQQFLGQVVRSHTLEKSIFKNKDVRSEHKLYTLMTLLEGDNLFNALYLDIKASLRKETLNLAQRLMIAIQCAEALQTLHEKNVIHGDVKPENIMVNAQDKETTLTLIDYGVSMLLPPGESQVLRDKAVGSPLFRAPESEEHRIYSFSSDIYAFGVMLEEDLLPDLAIQNEHFDNMTDDDPTKRPSLKKIIGLLKNEHALQIKKEAKPEPMAFSYLKQKENRHTQPKVTDAPSTSSRLRRT